MVIGTFGAVVGDLAVFFVAAGIWLLVGKILKGNVNYKQMMGVAGLASWIAIVGVVLSIAITVAFSRLDGGLHLGMLIPMAWSKTYSLLRSADLFTVWNLSATSIGIGTLSGKKGFMPAAWVFGMWIIFALISMFVFGRVYGG